MCRSVQIQSRPLCQPQAEAEEAFLFFFFFKSEGLASAASGWKGNLVCLYSFFTCKMGRISSQGRGCCCEDQMSGWESPS